MEPRRPNPDPNRSPGDVTRLLNLAAQGDTTAGAEIIPLLYNELRVLAAAKKREMGAGETLRSTALVHEAYLRVIGQEPDGWKHRSYFFFAAARAMRELLIEDARRRASGKHGGGLDRVSLDEAGVTIDGPPELILSLNRCLDKLEREDELGHQIILFRYFVGMSMQEIADTLEISLRSLERKWTFIRAWLSREMAST